MTSVPVREKIDAGTGTYWAPVNATAMAAPTTPIVTKLLMVLLKLVGTTKAATVVKKFFPVPQWSS